MRLRVNSAKRLVYCACHASRWRVQIQEGRLLVLKCASCGALVAFLLTEERRQELDERAKKAFELLEKANIPNAYDVAKTFQRHRSLPLRNGAEGITIGKRKSVLLTLAYETDPAAFTEAAKIAGMALVY